MYIIIAIIVILVIGYVSFLLAAYGDKSIAARIALPVVVTLTVTFIVTVIFAQSGLAYIVAPVCAITTMGAFILYKLETK